LHFRDRPFKRSTKPEPLCNRVQNLSCRFFQPRTRRLSSWRSAGRTNMTNCSFALRMSTLAPLGERRFVNRRCLLAGINR
jgi:hypothetical protein